VKDVIITEAKEGAVLSQTKDVTISNVEITTAKGNADVQAKSSTNLKIDGKSYKKVDAKGIKVTLK
jgi:hypothetical protein